MKATRMLTIRLEEDKQWRIRQYLSIYIGNILSILCFEKYYVNFNWEYYVNIFDNILYCGNIFSISFGNILAIFFGNIMSISIGNILSNLSYQVWDHFQSKINEGIQHNNPGKGIILSTFWVIPTKYHWSKNIRKKFQSTR